MRWYRAGDWQVDVMARVDQGLCSVNGHWRSFNMKIPRSGTGPERGIQDLREITSSWRFSWRAWQRLWRLLLLWQRLSSQQL